MNKLAFACSMLAIVVVAAWAYNVNYRTATALDRVEALRTKIAAEREHIQVLEVEWAWLNNPDRLARLVAMNADRLGLGPMTLRHFGRVAAVPFPPEPEPMLVGMGAVEDGELAAGLAMADGSAVMPPPRPAAKARP
ncbi:MAG TPA: cell division protein FtsL [Thermohalobaculum sp.]|nr:cell division protein FtsL [Thermohalobaculum sp.]